MGILSFVFPMFLFTMGISIPYALERRYAKGYSGESTLGHILSRTLALVLMGVFTVNSEGDFASALGYGKNLYRVLMVAAFFMIWNVYPVGMKAKKWLKVSGVMILAFLALTYRTPEGGYFSSRWWGILGIIGWTYCFCAVTYLLARKKPARIFFIWLGLIAVYTLLSTLEAYDKTAWFRFLSPSGTATLTVYMMPYLLYSLTGFFGLYTYDCLTGIPGLLKCALFSLVCVGLILLLRHYVLYI